MLNQETLEDGTVVVRLGNMSEEMLKMLPKETVFHVSKEDGSWIKNKWAPIFLTIRGVPEFDTDSDRVRILVNTRSIPNRPDDLTWVDAKHLGIKKEDFIFIFPGNSDIEAQNIEPIIVGDVAIPASSIFIDEGEYYKSKDESIFLKKSVYGKYFKA